MYALNLGTDGRVLSATLPNYAPSASAIVETLPEGNISDYKYINGEFIYDPLPKPEPPEPPAPTGTEARIKALEDELAATKILLGVE